MQAFTPLEPLRTAVLLIIFNRPETTSLVFEAIKQVQPPRLYIAADGPRNHVASDRTRCEEARQIISQVDWPCKVRTLFQDTNLNCGVAPSTAITWFFQHEREGIILEDDCLPSPSFFWYCEELLNRYRDDFRVMHIGGNNFLNGWRHDRDYSYYFSRSGHIWGWATWRRAWEKYDFNMSWYSRLKKKEYFKGFFFNWFEKLYRLRKFDATARDNQVTWWDYQWDFTRYIHSGLSIVPEVNLVRNIGFGETATHTRNEKSVDAALDANNIEFPLRHPPFMIEDKESGKRYFNQFVKNILVSKMN
jgi:hypothetical protein